MNTRTCVSLATLFAIKISLGEYPFNIINCKQKQTVAKKQRANENGLVDKEKNSQKPVVVDCLLEKGKGMISFKISHNIKRRYI